MTSKWVVDIHGNIEGDYDFIGGYEETKTGHWIKDTYASINVVECSFCHRYSLVESYCCPNCGARMLKD